MKGHIVRLYWIEEVNGELTDKQKEYTRSRAMQLQTWSAIETAILDPSRRYLVGSAIADGFKLANTAISSLEKGQELFSDFFMIGEEESIQTIKKIENSPNFVKWLDNYETDRVILG